MPSSESHLPISERQIIATMQRILDGRSEQSASDLLRRCHAKFKETGYDNWNGGTFSITLFIQLSPEVFTEVSFFRKSLESAMAIALREIAEPYNQSDNFEVRISPVVVNLPGRPDLEGPQLTSRVKRLIVSKMKSDKVEWFGKIGQVEFLEPLFDLEGLPSNDPRFKTAAQDIWQHTTNNEDWDLDWIFKDERFNLLGTDGSFLGFLERCVDPMVRSDGEAEVLVSLFNTYLHEDGWHLGRQELLGEAETYAAAPWKSGYTRSIDAVKRSILVLDSTWMAQEITRIEGAIDTDPPLAISAAKDMVDTCCKHILEKMDAPVNNSLSTPDLVKEALKHLKLLPDDVSEQAKGLEHVRKTLRTLSTIPQALSELRNLYGTGHGKGPSHRGLQPRHARLAVGAAATFVEFVTETMKDRKPLPRA